MITVDDNATVGTGSVVTYTMNDEILDSVTLIVMGDVNCDAQLSASDYLSIKADLLGAQELSEISTLAADINADGFVSASDYVTLASLLVGAN